MLKRAVHPGRVLKDELAEIGVTPTEFARQIKVPPNRVSQIIGGKRSITGDTALRLGHWFGIEPQFWLNLQAQFDLRLGRQGDRGINRVPAHRGRAFAMNAPYSRASGPPALSRVGDLKGGVP